MTRAAAAALCLLAAGCAAGPPVRTAAWVVRDRLASPEGVARACAAARDAGLGTAVLQVRGRGDAYYRSALAPRAEALAAAPDGFDPLAAAVDACQGLRVVAWLNVYYLWGGDEPAVDPAHPAFARPDWVLRDRDGRSVAAYGPVDRALGWIEGIYADPASAGYRDRFAAVAAEVVARYPVDGVHLDFVRYPGPAYGHGGPLGRWFEDAWGIDPRLLPLVASNPERWLPGDLAPADRVLATLALLWAEARAARVTALVAAVRAAVDDARPGVSVSAAVFPDPGRAYRTKGQDWRTWAGLGLVDELFPMAYFGGQDRVARQLRTAASLVRPVAPGVALWAGLGAFIKPVDAIRAEARVARGLDYDGVCLFDLGTVADGPGGLAAYVRAASGPRSGRGPDAPAVRPGLPRTRGGRILAALAERAWPAAFRRAPGRALDDRWAELARVGPAGLARAVGEARTRPVAVPAWVALRGVFRYVDPSDPPARRAEQLAAARTARDRVLAGEPFDVVAAETSQGGTARLGGVLGRRYLVPGAPGFEALRTARPGEVTPVVAVDNGYWVYRVEAREEATMTAFDDAPWPARRAAVRAALAALVAGRGGA